MVVLGDNFKILRLAAQLLMLLNMGKSLCSLLCIPNILCILDLFPVPSPKELLIFTKLSAELGASQTPLWVTNSSMSNYTWFFFCLIVFVEEKEKGVFCCFSKSNWFIQQSNEWLSQHKLGRTLGCFSLLMAVSC